MAVQISGNDITVPRDGSFTRNVTIGGTLTYEDVTNIDSVGLVTARTGIEIGARPGVAASISVDGNMVVSGISTVGELISSYGTFVRNVNDNGLTIAGGTASNSGANVTVYGGSHGSYPDTVRFRIDGSEKARIDSSGRLLLGTTTEGYSSADDLTVSTSGATGITIRSGTSNTGTLAFSDGTSGADEYRGYVQYEHQNNALAFGSNGTERFRITSGGAVGINETAPAAQLHVENDNANASTYYLNADATVLIQNKNTSASAKTVLKLEGPAGGGDCAFVYGDSSANLIFSDRENQRLRISSAGDVTVSDGDLIFGANGNALDFQNQTRESTSNYNRTVTAEKIDYYEEGYFDPTAISAGLTWDTSSNRKLRYVRIGNWVSVSGLLLVSSRTSNSNTIKVAMPFTSASQTSEGYYTRGVGAVMYQYVTLSANMDDIVAYVGGNENYMRFFQTRNDGGGWTELVNSNLGGNNSTQLYFSINYMVS